ncbi:hypothetical protein A0O34_15810 [Chryseobacterium glaciei]|uniref:C1q domain-containing protein n=1 Tax=Chryseobacterium glaciei TaxID=1685010 RepID=A0A172XY51_9FLAO|nr:hypothetical protein [Chryseobacterium glaciei]ANF51884.1 hypothetical protein A0O34_15810 [Chryseobacterium glaciei]
MKRIVLPFIVAFSILSIKSNAQVGVNTSAPASTLDVTAKNATGSTNNVDGLLVPRVDRLRAQSMASVPISTMIYINNAVTGTQLDTTINVDAEGYYYFNGTAWVKLHNPENSTFPSVNIYNTDGSLTGNRLVTQGTNTLAFSSNAVNGFSVDGSTFSVDALNNRVGIGTAAPHAPLQFGNTVGNRKIVLYETGNNDHEFYGFGVNSGIMRYQADRTTTDHVFYAGVTGGASSNELMRIKGTGNVGVGTATPTNLLHVNGTNPLRLEGLQPSSGKTGTLVVNSTGVAQLQTSSSISASRVIGNVTLVSNNTVYNIDNTTLPTETFDNLNEFNGSTFTASSAGLYKVDYVVSYPQRPTTEDSGDGYTGLTFILLNNSSYSLTATKINSPEVGGAPVNMTVVNPTIVKMSAGDVLRFQAVAYGTTGNVTANYSVAIVRID